MNDTLLITNVSSNTRIRIRKSFVEGIYQETFSGDRCYLVMASGTVHKVSGTREEWENKVFEDEEPYDYPVL